MPYMQPGMPQQVRPTESACFPTASCLSLPLHLHLVLPAYRALCSLAACCSPARSPTSAVAALQADVSCTLAGRCLCGKAASSSCRCRCMGPTICCRSTHPCTLGSCRCTPARGPCRTPWQVQSDSIVPKLHGHPVQPELSGLQGRVQAVTAWWVCSHKCSLWQDVQGFEGYCISH